MEMAERGWASIGDKAVCADCVGDVALRDFVAENASHDACSYCGNVGPAIAASADDVLGQIGEGVQSEWESPDHGVGYCSGEGGFDLSRTDTWDILAGTGLTGAHELFFEDVSNAFEQHEWVHHDPYGDRPCDALIYSWREFSKREIQRAQSSEKAEPVLCEILDDIETIANELGLVREVPVGTKLFRARVHDITETLSRVEDLGPPPASWAGNNRMSPKGVPMFYVAGDAATAQAEVRHELNPTRSMTIATFEVHVAQRVLDLSQVPEVPSLFDPHKRKDRMAILFLHAFAEEIVEPVTRTPDALAYIPTQVLTKYFRDVYRDSDGRPIDGIAYRSSRHPGGECFTLFADISACSDASGGKTFRMTSVDRR